MDIKKFYLAFFKMYEDLEIVGIYSSEEKAREAGAMIWKDDSFWGEDDLEIDVYHLDEVKI